MRRFVFLLLSFVILLGCDPDPHTTVKPPDAKAWTAADIDAMVDSELKSIYSPAPTENGQPPAECDSIRYLVLAPKDLDAEPDAIMTLSPGMQMGAGILSHLAKNLIYMAKTYKNANIKVLVIERRDNCLEDLTGMQAAADARDMQVAIDYYYNDKTLNGKTFQGFVTSDQAPYLSEFGLKLNIEDIYTVITTEVPDPATRRQKLFLAGHSMSGPTLGYFAGWDFDGDPTTLDDAGYRNCAGFIAIDTLLAPFTELIQSFLQMLPKMLATPLQSMLSSANYDQILANLRSGKMARTVGDQYPESFLFTELAAMQADWAPNQKSTLLNTVPYSKGVQQYLNSNLSGTYLEAMQPASYKRLNCTNLALAGLLIDNNFYPVGGGSLSVGFLRNGEVADKTFPIPDMLEQVPLVADLLQPTVLPADLYYPTGKNPRTLYQWVNFDEILESRYTSPDNEVVDIYDFLRTCYANPFDFFEWYLATRVVADVIYLGANESPTDYIPFYHPDYESKVPILNLFSEKGLIVPYMDTSKHDHVYLKGYTHCDPIMAANNRLDRRPHEVIGPMIDFMLSNIQ